MMATEYKWSPWQRLMLKISGGDNYRAFEVYWGWWHDRAEAKTTRKSPRYAEIRESLRTANGLIRWDGELFEEQSEIFWKVNRRPLYWYVHHWWEAHGRRAQRNARTLRKQRAERGWANQDVWGLDYYLSKVIIGSITHLRNTDHGHPSGTTEDEWHEILDTIVDGFKASQDIIEMNYDAKDRSSYDELNARFEKGMDLLKEYWFGLWD